MDVLIRRVLNLLFVRPYYAKKLKYVGRKFRLGYASEIIKAEFVSFGNNFFSGPRCYVSTNQYVEVKILNDVMFGPEVMILGGNHDFKYSENHMIHNLKELNEGRKIRIEDGVWVGARCILLTDTDVSEGAVIGAGSLVNHYVPPYVIAIGSPAKRYRKRFDCDTDLKCLLDAVDSKYSLDEISRIYVEYGLND